MRLHAVAAVTYLCTAHIRPFNVDIYRTTDLTVECTGYSVGTNEISKMLLLLSSTFSSILLIACALNVRTVCSIELAVNSCK